jgi:hypothetical protein
VTKRGEPAGFAADLPLREISYLTRSLRISLQATSKTAESNPKRKNAMKKYRNMAALTAMAGLVMYLAGGFEVTAASSEARHGFGFNSTDISSRGCRCSVAC